MITILCPGHYPSIEDRDMISCSVVNTNNITYNNLKALTDIPGKLGINNPAGYNLTTAPLRNNYKRKDCRNCFEPFSRARFPLWVWGPLLRTLPVLRLRGLRLSDAGNNNNKQWRKKTLRQMEDLLFCYPEEIGTNKMDLRHIVL